MNEITLSKTEREMLDKHGTIIIRRRVNMPDYGAAYIKKIDYLGRHHNRLLFSDEEGRHYSTNVYAVPGLYRVREYAHWQKCTVGFELDGSWHSTDLVGYAYRFENEIHYIGLPENAKNVYKISSCSLRSTHIPAVPDITRYYVKVTDTGICDTRTMTQKEICLYQPISETDSRESMYDRYLHYLAESEVSGGCYSSMELRKKPLWWHLLKITLVPKETAMETQQKGDAA